MEMIDLIKPKKVSKKDSDDYPMEPEYKPTISLEEKEYPVIKNWKLGKEYCVKVRMISKDINIKDARFEVVGIMNSKKDSENEEY